MRNRTNLSESMQDILMNIKTTNPQFIFDGNNSNNNFNYDQVNADIKFDENEVIRKIKIVRMCFQTPESGVQLAKLVRTKGITQLSLFDCKLSYNAVSAYSNALLEGIHNLYCLELDGSGVTDATLKQYRLAHPDSPFSVVTVNANYNDEDFYHIHGDYHTCKVPAFQNTLKWFAAKTIVDNQIPLDKLNKDAKTQVEEYKTYDNFRKN